MSSRFFLQLRCGFFLSVFQLPLSHELSPFAAFSSFIFSFFSPFFDRLSTSEYIFGPAFDELLFHIVKSLQLRDLFLDHAEEVSSEYSVVIDMTWSTVDAHSPTLLKDLKELLSRIVTIATIVPKR